MRTYPKIRPPKHGEHEPMWHYLARTRQEAGLSLRDVAASVQCAHSKIWIIEQGGPVEVDLFIDYCKAIGADPSYALKLRTIDLKVD